jgi:hypothetical protein
MLIVLSYIKSRWIGGVNKMTIGFYFDEFEEAAYYRYSQEAIDFMEKIVRCKDCKFFITDGFNRTMCNRTFTMFEMTENDFCSYGKRKE